MFPVAVAIKHYYASGTGPPALNASPKLRSMINLFCPWRMPLVRPDGSIGQEDRQQLVYCYTEILA